MAEWQPFKALNPLKTAYFGIIKNDSNQGF